jgi:tetratricopeptide (TPR) repeat protein
VFQHSKRHETLVDDTEKKLRDEFEALAEKAAKDGCKESLHKLGEMALSVEGIDASHKYMFSDFAMMLRKRNWLDLALSHAQRAVALAPDDAHTHFNVARIHMQMGDGDKARRALEEVLSITPDMGYAKAMLDQLDGKDPGA